MNYNGELKKQPENNLPIMVTQQFAVRTVKRNIIDKK